ncbi:MAG: aminoacyl-tRNA hydrolase [Treponema sp.]|jgi:PTH1 family peptidyl-tRNA hydrolase|nr:aminoacyl-tRNA hydrolase [Treponema sp.]
MIELAVFLGNPGREYARNRHNAGRLAAPLLPFYGSLVWWKKYRGLYAALNVSVFAGDLSAPGDCALCVPDRRVHFLMPETYMNLSGESAAEAASFFRIKAEGVIAVHDELELPLGTASFKFGGGLGGHNGLRSMKAALGTADFWRLRIGIGRPGHSDISGWVLSDFSAAEEETLEPVLAASALALAEALSFGPESLLPEWNKKKIRVVQ